MVDKKLPTGPIRISAPLPITKKDDPEAIPTILENNELSNTHESPTPTTLAQNSQKVSMRLSQEAATKLKQFRLDTGIPYEILVEVMILNFEKLPERSRKAYLEQARDLRMQRLIAGQEKALETVRSRARS